MTPVAGASAALTQLSGLPGRDAKLKGEYVVLSAHLDHLGVDKPVNGDTVYNGAMDNASGIASMIESARAVKAKKPKRSVLLVAVTGEERGLLGSRYFANRPTVAADAIVANIETMADLARAHHIRVVIGSVLPARRFDWRPAIDPVAAIADLNVALRALAARRGLAYADYYAALDDGGHGLSATNAQDGVHPTAAGYAVMQPIAQRALAAAR